MDSDFKYRPRFKDIRIRPPGGKPAEEVTLCEYPRCNEHATAKAPKSRERLNEHYHFCQKHAAEYNKSWNFFEGMASTFSCKVAFKNIVRAEVPSGAGARVLAERARYVKQRLYKHIAARLPFHCRVHRADRTNIR